MQADGRKKGKQAEVAEVLANFAMPGRGSRGGAAPDAPADLSSLPVSSSRGRGRGRQAARPVTGGDMKKVAVTGADVTISNTFAQYRMASGLAPGDPIEEDELLESTENSIRAMVDETECCLVCVSVLVPCMPTLSLQASVP